MPFHEDFIRACREPGDRYQKETAEFIGSLRPDVVVETGVHAGCLTTLILAQLDKNAHGTLFSCDPLPYFSESHPRWKLLRQLSVDAMPLIFLAVGPWDVFVHDSDHDVECQVYEYALAWDFLKPGGYLLSDDHTWGSPEHMAFKKHYARHNVTPMEPIGSCAVLQKPKDAEEPTRGNGWFWERARLALELAHQAAKEYGQTLRYSL